MRLQAQMKKMTGYGYKLMEEIAPIELRICERDLHKANYNSSTQFVFFFTPISYSPIYSYESSMLRLSVYL